MNAKKKQLIIALVLGVVAIAAHKLYVDSIKEELMPSKFVRVVRLDKPVAAGMEIRKKHLKQAKIPSKYVPIAAISWKEREAFLGQSLVVDVKKGDYLLENYFDTRLAMSTRLSQALEGENMRAISLPVDETNSLSRSILVGDRIDIVFTFAVPGLGTKMSTLLLQNVPIIATGQYSAAEQEIGARGGRPRKYRSLTLKLGIEDAMRLNYAQQVGKISLLLRSEADASMVDLAPISGVIDLLSVGDRAKVDAVARAKGVVQPDQDKMKAQMQEILRLQKQQINKLQRKK